MVQKNPSVKGVIAGDQYASLLGLELKAGPFFSKEFSTDSLALVINEKAVEEMGLTNPIGARLTTAEDFLNGPNGKKLIYTVVGVMKDFHFQSLHQKISPLILINANRFGGEMGMTGIRIKSEHFRLAISSIEKLWQRYVPGRPFNYTFLDRSLAEQYTSEQITRRIFTIFSVFAIFIACIGLMGLAAYNTQLRMREISIRKVLGARSGSIVRILSISYLKLVIVSAFIAFPIAWWAMHSWLQHFAYRTNMSWWIFIVAGLIAGVVALCTITIQAIKAAASNPVNNLRAE